jgi:hypothetical protein
MTAVGPSPVDHDCLQFVHKFVRTQFIYVVRISVGRHVQLQREFKAIVDLLTLPRLVIHFYAVQGEREHGGQPCDHLTLGGGSSFVARIARQFVIVVQRNETKLVLQGFLHTLVPFYGEHQVEEALSSSPTLPTL